MSASEVEVVIDGRLPEVFDVVTSAQLWPHWRVLTRAVAGVTERPFQDGDRIYEFVRTPAGQVELEYQVIENDRPRGAKFQAEDGTAVTYTLEGKADGTVFRRVLEFGSVFGGQKPPPAGAGTEQASVANLKALVENVLWRELAWVGHPPLPVPCTASRLSSHPAQPAAGAVRSGSTGYGIETRRPAP